MKNLSTYTRIYLMLLSPIAVFAQTAIYIHQECHQKKIGVLSPNDLVGIRVDKETIKFATPKYDEPTCIVFSVDTAGYKVEKVWVDSATKRIDLWVYNCNGYRSSVKNANLLTKEDRINKFYFEYLERRFTERESYLRAFNDFLMDYIQKNPTSFLSLDYASRLTDASDAKLREALNLLEFANGHYPTFQKLKNKLLYKNAIKMNEPIFDFGGMTLDSTPFSINDVNNKATLIMVWQSGCSAAKKIFPEIAVMQNKYAKDGLGVIYFSLDEDKASWKEISMNYKIPNVNISDLQGFNGKTALQFGITAIPAFYILDKEKKVKLVNFGDDAALLEAALKKILKE
jgi:thiol-disulfide isomerase/thioredoxin